MSVETINGYVLLAEPAEWSDPPTWTLAWDTEVAGALRGNEGRSALREMPRPTLSYSAMPRRTETQARLVAALLAGMASGKCCAPTFGRASWLAADAVVGAVSITIEPSAWNWKLNDWLLVYNDDGSHQARQITAIDGTQTVFSVAALTAGIAGQTAVYPLFFGRPEMDDITQTTGERSTVPIKLIGDEFQISQTIPTCCTTPDLTLFDFAVIRYQWTSANGYDLDTRTALISPVFDLTNTGSQAEVGYARNFTGTAGQGKFPAGSSQPYLYHGGDNSTSTGAEAVLLNFPAIAAVYPAVPSIVVRLRAYWYGSKVDGNINLQFATYRGGVMTGSGTNDFINVGGVPVQIVNRARNVALVAPSTTDGQNLGTLVYTVATKSAVILPP